MPVICHFASYYANKKKKCCSNLRTVEVTTIMLQFHMYLFGFIEVLTGDLYGLHLCVRTLSLSMLTPELLKQLRQWNVEAQGNGQSLAEMALQWILNHEAVTSVLIGASSVAQLKDNLGTLKFVK